MMTTETLAARPAAASPLPAIVLVLATGVLTGAQLGKIAPLIPWYRAEIGLSLVATGWLAAILGVFIALAALPAGWAIDRFGLQRSFVAGAVAIIGGGALLAGSQAPTVIFAARLLEALGYLALCIGLPAILNQISPPTWKAPVLAIWSGFVPLGYATSDFLAAAILPGAPPATFLFAMTGLFAALALATLGSLRGQQLRPDSTEGAGSLRASLTTPVVLVALSFGMFVVLSVSMFTFMPSFITGAGSHYLISAGAVALTVPLGNVLASVMVRGKPAIFMARLAVAGFAISALTAVPAFTLASPLAATIAAVLLAVSGALVASSQFAAIPFITPRDGSVPVAIGLVCQAGGIGTVFGPPVAALTIERFGWPGFGWFLAAIALFGLAAMLPLMRANRR